MREPIEIESNVFEDTGLKVGSDCKVDIPANYANGANLVIVWTSDAIAGKAVFEFEYLPIGGDDVEKFNQSPIESVEIVDNAPSQSGRRVKRSVSLTDGNFSPNDSVRGKLYVNSLDARHTLSGSIKIEGLFFEYS